MPTLESGAAPRERPTPAGRAYPSPMKVGAKRLAKTLLRRLLYRYPPIGLQPERLQLWLRTLIETAPVDGDVVEIGCSLGGTAAYSWRMLRNLRIAKRYVCIDTFAGFVPAQFDDDLGRADQPRRRHHARSRQPDHQPSSVVR